MKTESDETTPPTQDSGNVVPFPRDWLGPREELVPLERTEAAAPPTGAAPRGAAPRADDFWGGDSWAVQDAWQAPEETGEIADAAPRRLPAFAALAPGLPPGTLRRRLAAAFAVFAALAAAAVAVAGGGAPSRSGGDSSTKLAAKTTLHVGSAHVSQKITYRRPPVHHPRVHHLRVLSKHMGRGGAHAHAASSSAATRSSTVTPTSASTNSGATNPTTSYVANPAPQHEDSMASTSTSSPGHPTGAGAPFAPGYIP